VSVEQIRFVHPELLLLLALVVPLLGLYAATFQARRRALAAFAAPGAALVSTSAWRQVARAGLALIAAASLVVALSGPYVEEHEIEVRWKGIDLVVALDVSQSMGVQDVPPDRLRAARAAIQSLSAQIGGSRVAHVLFGASGVVR
jgi:Ca-activated chloride channel family protein